MAPLTSAAVTIAKPSWKVANSNSGTGPRAVRVDAQHPDVLEAADQSAGAVVGERDRVADQQPGDGHQRDRDEAGRRFEGGR
jgi:hypothetical protein